MPPAAAFASAHSSVGVRHCSRKPEERRCAHPVDLVHLSKQSLGDRALETEILRLFLSQSMLYLDRLERSGSVSERKLAAHTIVGSARGIGAWHVADCAAKHSDGKDPQADLSELKEAIAQSNSYIERLLAE
ncbi:MAG: Hpt domain-containing protein [Ahrensia sp.]|nr:Hpt domain-containing protein [Ahrensia sp.]